MLESPRAMDRKPRRTVIDISSSQPEFDFDEGAHSPPFTLPEYQRAILPQRFVAEVIDFGIAAVVYVIFLVITLVQLPESVGLDKRLIGIYAAGFLVLVGVYFLIFMLSASQTPGMKLRGLVVVNRDGYLLDPG